jgi:Cu/Ag efflux protein CusF
MKAPSISAILIVVAALSLAGCGEPASTDADAMRAMPVMPPSGADGEHVALGTVNSIDIESGTINISHDPVASLGWPAMTMLFQLADQDLASRVEPGQRIEFRFTTDDGGTVTAIEREP